MKKINHIILTITVLFGVSAIISGCSLGGLSLQKDFNRSTTDTIDAHLYKTAWEYIKSRAYGSKTDTLFRRMYDGIIYSGIDTNEYIKPNRTFILLTNNTIITTTVNANNTITRTGLWVSYTNNGVQGTSWASYSKQDVKNYLLYLILQAQYSHYNLPLKVTTASTLAPAGVYTANPVTFKAPVANGATYNPNPNSQMLIRLSNANTVTSQLDYPIVLNESINITTSDLLATNGVVSVVSNNTATVPIFFPVQ